MNSLNSMRIAAAAARPLRTLSRGAPAPTTPSRLLLQPQQHHSRRLYSSEPPPRPQSFNKTFSRPIFKVALMAIFTYQLAYYGWLRLEQNEKRGDLNKMMADLEKVVAELDPEGTMADLKKAAREVEAASGRK
ncbi:hypothetical protein PG997_013909 [Apiospora hydei]|uniref:Uncharacterized protein n=1 Tax=Apiospora hydei TaxID=1337664 RepID=A0ABR1V8D6_9PEZI